MHCGEPKAYGVFAQHNKIDLFSDLLDRSPAAIYKNILACDIARSLGSKKERGPLDILLSCHAPQQSMATIISCEIRRRILRFETAGRKAVHANLIGRKKTRQVSSQTYQSPLGEAVIYRVRHLSAFIDRKSRAHYTVNGGDVNNRSTVLRAHRL